MAVGRVRPGSSAVGQLCCIFYETLLLACLHLGFAGRRLAEKGRLFGGSTAPGMLARHNKFSCADMAACDEDASPDLRGVAEVLERVLEIRGTTRQQRATVSV